MPVLLATESSNSLLAVGEMEDVVYKVLLELLLNVARLFTVIADGEEIVVPIKVPLSVAIVISPTAFLV
jgi:hypothetical protein